MVQVKRYQFNYGRFGEIILDDQGRERHQRLATDEDVQQLLEGSDLTSPSEHLDALTRQEMDRFPQLDYRQALQRVQDRNPEIVRLHASENNGAVKVVSYRENDVSASIAAKVQLLIEADPGKKRFKSYSDAVRHVLSESPELTRKYASYTSEAAYRRAS